MMTTKVSLTFQILVCHCSSDMKLTPIEGRKKKLITRRIFKCQLGYLSAKQFDIYLLCQQTVLSLIYVYDTMILFIQKKHYIN